MVGALENKYLRQALLIELVSLDDLICPISTQPVLISIAESDRKGQVGIA